MASILNSLGTCPAANRSIVAVETSASAAKSTLPCLVPVTNSLTSLCNALMFINKSVYKSSTFSNKFVLYAVLKYDFLVKVLRLKKTLDVKLARYIDIVSDKKADGNQGL